MLSELNKLYDLGMLIKQTHPTLPLTIWNYSRTVQFENSWDFHPLLVQCRGLVTDDETGVIVARPFKKFWNIEEDRHTPTKDFYALEKMDGSYINVFNYKSDWIVSSRGSFTSDQALWATEIWGTLEHESFYPEFTYIFELLKKENRIVVNYGDYEGLVLLGAIKTETNEEMDYHLLSYYGYTTKVVKRYDGFTDITKIKNLIEKNKEGFVIVFSNGDKMKIKSEEYFRLHKIMTEVSTTSVWEVLKNGESFEKLLIDVPDEFDMKIKEYIKDLTYTYMTTNEYFGKLFDNYLENRNYELPNKKEYSEWVNTFPKKLEQGIFWNMYNNKDYSQIIWKLIKPKYSKL